MLSSIGYWLLAIGYFPAQSSKFDLQSSKFLHPPSPVPAPPFCARPVPPFAIRHSSSTRSLVVAFSPGFSPGRKMKFLPTTLPGVWIIDLELREDERGFLA